MGTRAVDRPWRWRDTGLAILVWFVPITGLLHSSEAVTIERALGSILIGAMVGMVMSVPLPSVDAGMSKTASARRVAEAVATAGAGAALLALLGLDHRSFLSVVAALGTMWVLLAISVTTKPLSIARSDGDLDTVSFMPVPRRSPISSVGKRGFDLFASTLLITAATPLLLAVAVVIKLGDGGPVLFRQQRVGRNGAPFEMLKFRSMVVNAEDLRSDLDASSERTGPLFKMSNDPRITPLGRLIRELSIDELPQLFNILRGDMSLVGPRPALPAEAELFDTTLRRRTAVTPGLTGLWQAEARSDADFERFRDLDLRYVSTASPALDFWIIVATATEILVAVAAAPLAMVGVRPRRNDGIDLRESTTSASGANEPTGPTAA